MSTLLSWLEKAQIEMKVKSIPDGKYNIIFIYWDIYNKRCFLEYNLEYSDIAKILSRPTELIKKLQFIEFKLKGTL